MIRTRIENKRENIDALADKLVERISGAAKRERWGSAILKLAWTAGPVTYLGLNGGYFFVYGTVAPSKLFLYFALYTFIAGLFAFFVRFFYSATKGEEQQKAKEDLLWLLSHFPDIIVKVRNSQLNHLDQEGRKILTAKYILENPDAPTNAIAAVIYDLTANEKLARLGTYCETLKRAGLMAGISDLYNKNRDQIHSHAQKISEQSPMVAKLFKEKFKGHGPSKHVGRTRTKRFLQRIITADEEENLDLMSMTDVEEMMVLAYEIIAGRQFPVLYVRYVGDKKYTDISTSLDRERLEYRRLIFDRNSRLRILAEELQGAHNFNSIVATLPEIKSFRDMITAVHHSIQHIAKETQTKLKAYKKRHNVSKAEALADYHSLNKLLWLYNNIYRISLEAEKKHAALMGILDDYIRFWRRYSPNHTIKILGSGEKGSGLKITTKKVKLSDNDILPFARYLASLLKKLFDVQEKSLRDNQFNGSVEKEYKKTAVQVLRKLESLLPITRHQIQRAIEGTNSAYLTALESSLTADVKLRWGVALVHEVRDSLRQNIHVLAKSLVDFHNIALDQETIESLVTKFNADREYLMQLIPEEWENEAFTKPDVPSPCPVPPLDSTIQSALRELKPV